MGRAAIRGRSAPSSLDVPAEDDDLLAQFCDLGAHRCELGATVVLAGAERLGPFAGLTSISVVASDCFALVPMKPRTATTTAVTAPHKAGSQACGVHSRRHGSQR